MKIIIHGGFFSESDQSSETEIAKQNSLKNIVEKLEHPNDSTNFHSALCAVHAKGKKDAVDTSAN